METLRLDRGQIENFAEYFPADEFYVRAGQNDWVGSKSGRLP